MKFLKKKTNKSKIKSISKSNNELQKDWFNPFAFYNYDTQNSLKKEIYLKIKILRECKNSLFSWYNGYEVWTMNEYINLDENNIEEEHICCAIGDPKHQDGVDKKKEWIKSKNWRIKYK